MALTKSEEVDIDKLASFERMRIFAARAKRGAITAPLGVFFLAAIEMPFSEPATVVAWLSLMLLAEMAIYGAASGFIRHQSETKSSHWRLNLLITLNAFIGAGWGSSVWFFYPTQELAFTVNLATLAAVAGLSLLIMAPVRPAILFFAIGLLLPPVIQAFVFDFPLRNFVISGMCVLFIIQISYGFQAHNELKQAVHSWVLNKKLVENLARSEEGLREKNARLEEISTRLRELVIRDDLTGTFNRRFIYEELGRHVQLKRRHNQTASLILLDLDHFKMVNDSMGHEIGDKVLVEVSAVLKRTARTGDLVARIGGEEFLVVLPMTNLESAIAGAERLRREIAAMEIEANGTKVRITASFGVSELREMDSVGAWVKRADQAVYLAKIAGRNCIEPPPSEKSLRA
jgi:diguanylate cyclase (GGDEF)-like protein